MRARSSYGAISGTDGGGGAEGEACVVASTRLLRYRPPLSRGRRHDVTLRHGRLLLKSAPRAVEKDRWRRSIIDECTLLIDAASGQTHEDFRQRGRPSRSGLPVSSLFIVSLAPVLSVDPTHDSRQQLWPTHRCAHDFGYLVEGPCLRPLLELIRRLLQSKRRTVLHACETSTMRRGP